MSCLVNRDAMGRAPLRVEVPDGVHVERPLSNLGWSGGLHLLRTLSDAELFVWVQDDMLPEPGWLDALVDAADAHPSVGLFGALRVGDKGEVLLYNGGWARPPDLVAGWNATDTTPEDTPTEVTRLDWVTSKGCLTRTECLRRGQRSRTHGSGRSTTSTRTTPPTCAATGTTSRWSRRHGCGTQRASPRRPRSGSS